MKYLDQSGLQYFWDKILAKLNVKASTKDMETLEDTLREEIDDAAENIKADLSAYETKEDAQTKLEEAKLYAGDAALNVKNDLLKEIDDIDFSIYETKENAQANLDAAKDYTDEKVTGLASTSFVESNISTHNTATNTHGDIRDLITDLSTKLNNFLDVDDTTADQLSEVLTLIENNKDTLESFASSKVNVADIINNLTTNVTNKPLSAAQGVAIKALIDALEDVVETKAAASDLTAHTGNKSNPHGVSLSQLGLTATAAELNYVDGVTSNIQTQLNKKMGDYSIELYNGTAGNPKPVRFASFNYSTCGSEEGIAAKIGMVSGHGNGSSYAFMQDVVIRVNHVGTVEVDNMKYYGADAGTYDGAARQYGDIFWLIDETNKIIDFYCLMGQYARVNSTPWKRLTYSSKGTVTQHTSCTVYSSGTKNWANNDEFAMKSEINDLQLQINALIAAAATIHSGETAPPNSLGEDGDFYVYTGV